MPTEHTGEVFDMRPFLDAPSLPLDPSTGNPMIQTVIPREGAGVWYVRVEPLRLDVADGPLAWTFIREGTLVRIPLLPYRTKANPAHAMLAGMDFIQRYLEMHPRAKRTHIVIGDPIEEVDNMFRFWLGFAIQIQ